MQQPIRIAKGPIHAKLAVPGSKSISYRAVILAALAEGVSEISGLFIDDDIRTLLIGLHQLGIATQLDESARSCIIAGGNGRFPRKQATIWCGHAKMIARLLMSACAASPGVYYFDGPDELRRQTLSPLLTVLKRQGVQVIPSDARTMPLTLVGADTLEGGTIILDRPSNTQIVSAMLLSAPYARSPFTFTLRDATNQQHIDLTCAMMAEFDVLVHRIHQGQLMVPVPQRYYAKDYSVEPDLALSSYFFAAAAVTGGEVTIQPIKRGILKQRAVKFLSVLEKMGCRLIETHTGFTVKSTHPLQGMEVSMRDFSDTFMALAAIAPFAKSPTRISYIGEMKTKEKERMHFLKVELIKMGIHVETSENWIKIFPGTPKGGMINTHNDYRFAMAFSIIGLKSPGVIIDNSECIASVYPDFFNAWEKLSQHLNINA